jgi:hypothetical protein
MQKVTVLYNDQCPVCSIEIEHYRGLSLRHAPHLDFEPLSVPGPVYTALGLTLENAKRRLHLARTTWLPSACEGGSGPRDLSLREPDLQLDTRANAVSVGSATDD